MGWNIEIEPEVGKDVLVAVNRETYVDTIIARFIGGKWSKWDAGERDIEDEDVMGWHEIFNAPPHDFQPYERPEEEVERMTAEQYAEMRKAYGNALRSWSDRIVDAAYAPSPLTKHLMGKK